MSASARVFPELAAPEKTFSRERVDWIDVAKAIGIILVVFGHVERGLRSSGVIGSDLWDQVDFALYTFHMPLFFFLVGMTTSRMLGAPGFFWARAQKIIILYLAFSLLQGGIQLGLSGQTNGEITLQRLLLIPVLPISPFWFLYVLLIYVGVLSILRPGWPLLLAAVALLALSPLARVNEFMLVFQILYFFLFFVVGAMFTPRKISGRIGGMAALGWGVTVLAGLVLGLSVEDHYALVMLPAAVLGSVAVMWLAQLLQHSISLAYIGRNVVAVYVMHILATAGCRIVLLKLGIDEPVFHIVLGTTLGVALPFVALEALQRLRLAGLLGLPPRPTLS